LEEKKERRPEVDATFERSSKAARLEPCATGRQNRSVRTGLRPSPPSGLGILISG